MKHVVAKLLRRAAERLDPTPSVCPIQMTYSNSGTVITHYAQTGSPHDTW